MKIGLKRRVVEEIGYKVKLQCLTEKRKTTFGSIYREFRKFEGSRNRDSKVNPIQQVSESGPYLGQFHL